MQVIELNLPARFAACDKFKRCYGTAHHAGDLLQRMTTEDGRLRDNVDSADTKLVLSALTEAVCAARELDNILADNPPPRRGE